MNVPALARLAAPISLGFLLQGIGIWTLLAPDVLVGLRISVAWGIALLCHAPLLLYKHRWDRRRGIIAGLTTAQAAVCALSWIGTEVPDYGLWKLNLFLAMAVTISLLLLHLYGRSEVLVSRFLVAVIVFTAVPLATVYHFASTYGIEELRWCLLESREADVIGLSRSLGMGALVASCGVLYLRGIVFKSLAACALMVLSVAQMSLTERGPILATSLSVTYMILEGARGSTPTRRRITPLLVAAVVILQVLLFMWFPRTWERFSLEKISNDGRIIIYEQAFQEVLGGESLLGVGLGNFTYSPFALGARQYAHNIFGEVLVETGLPGLFVLIAYCAAIWRFAFASEDGGGGVDPLVIICRALFLNALLNAQVSGDLGTNSLLWVFGALVFCAVETGRRHVQTGGRLRA